MYEICRLLAAKKAPKARKPSAPRKASAKIGARVLAYGPGEGIIVGFDAEKNWWNIEFRKGDKVVVWGCARKCFEVIG